MPSRRVAVTAESFMRTDPAAAFLGLVKSRSPASAWRWLSSSKASKDM
jgi:hypothetical protein